MLASPPGNSMQMSHFGRTQQMWVLIVACLFLFALFLLLIPGMTFAFWWKAFAAGLAACAVAVFLFNWWLKRVLARRDGVVTLINRITAGDLSASAREISTQTQSLRMSAAMRGLVSNL